MAGAISQPRQSCQFLFRLMKNSLLYRSAWPKSSREASERFLMETLGGTQNERHRRLALAGGFRLLRSAASGPRYGLETLCEARGPAPPLECGLGVHRNVALLLVVVREGLAAEEHPQHFGLVYLARVAVLEIDLVARRHAGDLTRQGGTALADSWPAVAHHEGHGLLGRGVDSHPEASERDALLCHAARQHSRRHAQRVRVAPLVGNVRHILVHQ